MCESEEINYEIRCTEIGFLCACGLVFGIIAIVFLIFF